MFDEHHARTRIDRKPPNDNVTLSTIPFKRIIAKLSIEKEKI